jgi:alpha-beta hydrolase superfamily lysophospholipase
MAFRHCICVAVVLLAGSARMAAGQLPPGVQAGATSSFMIFLRGTAIGAEQMTVMRTAEGWDILSTGRLGPPLDVVSRKLEVRYTSDWKPLEFTLDSTVRGEFQKVFTTFSGTTATSEITIGTGTEPTRKTDTIEPNALILPNAFYSPYEALAAQLKNAAAGAMLPAYILPVGSVTLRVGASTTEQIQTATRLITAKKTRVTANSPGTSLDFTIWGDENGRLLEMTVPAQGLDVARTDIASVSSRHIAISRPNDEQVRIPAIGFTLAGTLSRPADAATAPPRPAVILTAGAGPLDRDALTAGIPILGQLAGALADAGFIVLRYDKRGVGQSGGRTEVASLADFSDDQRAAVKFLTSRKDVDDKRIAVVGHSEGGLVSLLSAAKEKRIDAVVLLATPGVTGADLVLEQQRHALSKSNLSDAEKQARIDMQKKINEAAVTGKGLDGLTPAVRRQLDNAEFQSVLAADPAKLVPNVRQPILVVQGERDMEVTAPNADRLEALAKARKQPAVVEVIKIPGVNHLLVPAQTGEVGEYSALPDKEISPVAMAAVVDWLKKTLK